jgi:lysophospholipase L1-like esterase
MRDVIGITAAVVILFSALEMTCRFIFGAPPLPRSLPPKSPHEFRVMVYGESTVVGAFSPELGFVKQLQFWLKESAPDRNIRVFNLGVSGANSATIKSVVAKTVHADPDLVILLLGHNEFLKREMGPGWVARQAQRLSIVNEIHKYLKRRKVRSMKLELAPYDRNEPLFNAKIENFRKNLAEMIIEIKKEKSARFILGTVAANIRDWPPVHRALPLSFRGSDYEPAISVIETALTENMLDVAERKIAEVFKQYPNDAMATYLLGKVNLRRGNLSRAREALLRAKDIDPIPWRVLSELNEITRTLAREYNVELVDIERVFAAKAEHGLPGLDLLADNCHPTPFGNSLIATELMRGIARFEIFPAEKMRSCCSFDQFVSSLGDHRDNYFANFWMNAGLYLMKTPFFNFGISRIYFERDIELKPREWRAWGALGTISLLEGKRDEGIRQLRKASIFKQSNLDENDPTVPYLHEALRLSNVALNELNHVSP